MISRSIPSKMVTPDISRMVPMSGGVRLNVIADKPAGNGITTRTIPQLLPMLRCGDVVEAPMRIKVAERYRDPGAWQYADYLPAQGIGAHASVRASKLTQLDQSSASLSHSDHMGGMPAVLRNFRPRELWVSIDPNSDAYRALLSEAKDLGVKVCHFYAGDQVAWGGMQVTMLAPETGYTNPQEPVNNDSLVMRMQYGKSSVLLEGDAEAPSEREMLAHSRVAAVTLLKVGHHGSRTSTTQEFLDAARPKDAVVSVGRGNTFGHPRYEVVERIAEARIRLYRTDQFGLTTFLLGRDGGIHEIAGASN